MTSYKLIQEIGTLTKVDSHEDVTFGLDKRILQTFTVFQTDGSNKHTYRLNEHGYRSNENYDNLLMGKKGDYILCLGCSHTEGIGVDVEERWSEVLGRKLGLPVMNCGLTSGSEIYSQYVYWNIKFMEEFSQMPKYVFSLQPPQRRNTIMSHNRVAFFQDWNWKTDGWDGNLTYYSIPNDKSWEVIGSKQPEENHGIDSHVFNSYSSTFQSMCKNEGIVNLEWDVLGEDGWELASDNMHYGRHWHSEIANLFFNEVENRKSAI